MPPALIEIGAMVLSVVKRLTALGQVPFEKLLPQIPLGPRLFGLFGAYVFFLFFAWERLQIKDRSEHNYPESEQQFRLQQSREEL